jgi:hypothetical protein
VSGAGVDSAAAKSAPVLVFYEQKNSEPKEYRTNRKPTGSPRTQKDSFSNIAQMKFNLARIYFPKNIA